MSRNYSSNFGSLLISRLFDTLFSYACLKLLEDDNANL